MSVLVLIATTMDDGNRWLAAQPAPPARVVIVTRRSPGAARGYTADAVLLTPAAQQLPKPVRSRLLGNAMPCVATRPRRTSTTGPVAGTAQN